jgi:hypothetical protein
VQPYDWYAHKKGKTFYAERSEQIAGGQRTVSMHSLLTGYPRTDHIDGDGLNNHRANLRAASNAQNLHNQGVNTKNTSGFKGVSYYSRNGKWQAKIRVNGIKRHLGHFLTPEDAARAYDKAALELFGEFARSNATMGCL